MTTPRPNPTSSESITVPLVRRTFFGLRRGQPITNVVQVCFHPDEGFWLECPAGITAAEVEAQCPEQLAAARERISNDHQRRSRITSSYRKRPTEQISVPLSRTETASLTRFSREVTTDKLQALRTRQRPDSDRIPPQRSNEADPAVIDHEAAVDVFAEIDAASEVAPPKIGTSPFRHGREEVTARIKALRERSRSPLPSPVGVVPPDLTADEYAPDAAAPTTATPASPELSSESALLRRHVPTSHGPEDQWGEK